MTWTNASFLMEAKRNVNAVFSLFIMKVYNRVLESHSLPCILQPCNWLTNLALSFFLEGR